MTLLRELSERLADERADLPRAMREAEDIAEAGFRGLPRHQRFLERALDLAELIADVKEGKRRDYWLTEAMSMSDFPTLFGFTIERVILDRYTAYPATWTRIARRRVVPDFRNIEVKRRAYGAGARLTAVPELTEYPEASLTEQSPITYKVAKFGRRLSFSFELSVGDVLGELEDVPQEFGAAARETENYAATEQYATTTGPHATLYSSGNANIVTANPALSIAGLQTAMTVLASQKDEQGRPIFIRAITLVVPPALEIVARNILNATELSLNTAGGVITGLANSSGVEQRLQTINWMRGRVELVVDPYLPIVSTTNGNTSWYLFADVAAGEGAALEMAFLRGYEQPQIWLKEPNARRIGGGGVDPMEGDFDFDAITYRIRHILGSAQISPKLTAASNGTGS